METPDLVPGSTRTGPVLYILGAGRSGSTLVERVLGQDSRVATLGEVHHLWERGIVRNELCGCGQPFHECPYWNEIGQLAFGGWAEVDLEKVRRLGRQVDRQRRLLRTANPWPKASTTGAATEYANYYRRIYRAALTVAQADVVIDSGKHPSLAMALSHDRRIDLRALHVVRDSMGVSYSWSKEQARPEARSKDHQTMSQHTSVGSSAYWLSANLESELVRVRRVPYARMRYEDFVNQPTSTMKSAWERLRLPGVAPSPVDSRGHIHLVPNHTVAGNPSRFAVGDTRLRPDDAWKVKMVPSDRRKVAIMTGLIRRAYGYRG